MTSSFIKNASGAIISDNKEFRYVLWRSWGNDLFSAGSKMILFIGLNPSTADATQDDPTLRRCIGFARTFEYNALYMVNLFAFRATDPRAMFISPDPVGPRNNAWLQRLALASDVIVACWGSFGGAEARIREVMAMLPDDKLFCLAVNGDGSPAHPLYLPKTSQLIKYPTQ